MKSFFFLVLLAAAVHGEDDNDNGKVNKGNGINGDKIGKEKKGVNVISKLFKNIRKNKERKDEKKNLKSALFDEQFIEKKNKKEIKALRKSLRSEKKALKDEKKETNEIVTIFDGEEDAEISNNEGEGEGEGEGESGIESLKSESESSKSEGKNESSKSEGKKSKGVATTHVSNLRVSSTVTQSVTGPSTTSVQGQTTQEKSSAPAKLLTQTKPSTPAKSSAPATASVQAKSSTQEKSSAPASVSDTKNDKNPLSGMPSTTEEAGTPSSYQGDTNTGSSTSSVLISVALIATAMVIIGLIFVKLKRDKKAEDWSHQKENMHVIPQQSTAGLTSITLASIMSTPKSSAFSGNQFDSSYLNVMVSPTSSHSFHSGASSGEIDETTQYEDLEGYENFVDTQNGSQSSACEFESFVDADNGSQSSACEFESFVDSNPSVCSAEESDATIPCESMTSENVSSSMTQSFESYTSSSFTFDL